MAHISKYTGVEIESLLDNADLAVKSNQVKTINGESIIGVGDLKIQTGQNNVKSDWNETDLSSDAFILNKPSIPKEVTETDVYNWGFTKEKGTITGIKMNGIDKGTSGVVDLGTVITSHQDISHKVDKDGDKVLTTNDFTNELKNKLVSLSNYDDSELRGIVEDIDKAVDGLINSKADKSSIPTKVSELENDSGFATTTQVNNKQDIIQDLETIRDNAKKGSTALQSFTEVDPIFKASPASGITASNISNWNNKVDKDGAKVLSTNDFTNALKQKLESLSNYDDSSILSAINDLRSDLDTLVGGNSSVAIDSFNEIVGFLEGVENSEDLAGIISSLESQISNKADKSSVPTKVSQLTNDSSYATTTQLNTKQNTISDLAAIRDGASKGATALQSHQDISHLATKAEVSNKVDKVSGKGLSTNDYTTAEKNKLSGIATGAEVNVQSDWNVTESTSDAYIKNKPSLATVATSGSYNDLSNKPTIPSAVTESTVSGWGFTKNPGTYSKPSTGIPKTDLASAVQSSLSKADSALQSFTESDPVFKASAAYKITTNDITNWNGKTSNTGTVTGVKMNGATKNPSNGVVDLGTVITAHQDISGKQNNITDLGTIRTNATNGATAYGWGNHASAGYLKSVATATTSAVGVSKLVTGDVNGKAYANGEAAAAAHTHGQYLTALPSHNHDDRYYTESEMNTKLAAKSNTGHTHTKAEVGLSNVDNTADSAKTVKRAASADSAEKLSGGSIPTWGTLTSTNGYTNVCSWDTGDTTGAFTLAGKGGKMSLQIDGLFYQNEGQYQVLDTNTGAPKSHTHTSGQVSGLATVATSGKYSDLSGLPTIPTNTNQLTNGAGFVTSSGVTNVVAGNGLTGGGSSATSTLNVGAGTGISVAADTVSVVYGTTAGTACQGNDSRLSNSRPASDVYAWAKASSKPSYTKSEVGLGNVDNTADANKSVKYATSSGSCTGNAATATKATQDSSGNVITSTYATKAEVNAKTTTLKFTNLTASSWVADSTYSDFAYKCDVTCSGVTTNDYAEVIFDLIHASSGKYAPICETISNGVRVWSAVNTTITIPTIIITR